MSRAMVRRIRPASPGQYDRAIRRRIIPAQRDANREV